MPTRLGHLMHVNIQRESKHTPYTHTHKQMYTHIQVNALYAKSTHRHTYMYSHTHTHTHTHTQEPSLHYSHSDEESCGSSYCGATGGASPLTGAFKEGHVAGERVIIFQLKIKISQESTQKQPLARPTAEQKPSHSQIFYFCF